MKIVAVPPHALTPGSVGTTGGIDIGSIGSIVVEPDEARVLVSLSQQMQSLLADALEAGTRNGATETDTDTDTATDTAVQRLLPNAYRDDPELADEWRRFSRRGLIERKIGFARTLTTALIPVAAGDAEGTVSLTTDAALDWVRGIGDLRLVIADRMGIVVDGDEARAGEPGLQDLYELLAWMQDGLVQLLEAADDAALEAAP
jgi:hypothetical protein